MLTLQNFQTTILYEPCVFVISFILIPRGCHSLSNHLVTIRWLLLSILFGQQLTLITPIDYENKYRRAHHFKSFSHWQFNDLYVSWLKHGENKSNIFNHIFTFPAKMYQYLNRRANLWFANSLHIKMDWYCLPFKVVIIGF